MNIADRLAFNILNSAQVTESTELHLRGRASRPRRDGAQGHRALVFSRMEPLHPRPRQPELRPTHDVSGSTHLFVFQPASRSDPDGRTDLRVSPRVAALTLFGGPGAAAPCLRHPAGDGADSATLPSTRTSRSRAAMSECSRLRTLPKPACQSRLRASPNTRIHGSRSALNSGRPFRLGVRSGQVRPTANGALWCRCSGHLRRNCWRGHAVRRRFLAPGCGCGIGALVRDADARRPLLVGLPAGSADTVDWGRIGQRP